MSKLDIKCLDEGYSFVDICGLPLYRGSGLKCECRDDISRAIACLPLYRGSGLKCIFVVGRPSCFCLPLYRGSGLKY